MIIVSSSASITPFNHRFSHTAVLRPTRSLPNQLFHSLTACYFVGDGNFDNSQYKAFNKPTNQDVIQYNNLPFVNEQHEIKKYVEEIKSILGSMNDGAISSSAYDTAWVALIENVDGPSGSPQFPSSLQWVVEHQLADGSWGEPLMFSSYDRLISTLACVIALTSWNIHPEKCQKGMKFMEETINKLEHEKEEYITLGFKIVFPTLIERARTLGIKVADDSPALKEIYAIGQQKLAKIPKDLFHKTPTTLLYSLEGMKDLEWEKLLKLRCENGSFLFSPAATSFAFMQTKDQKCLEYLTNLVAKFSGGGNTMHFG